MLRSKLRMRVTFALVSAAGLALPSLGGTAALAGKATPAGTTNVWKVYLSTQATKVDVLVLVIQHGNNKDAAYWDAQVPQP